MPDNKDLKTAIQTALSAFENNPLADAARGLLNTLGYQSNKTLKITPNTAQGFQALFGREKAIKDEARLQDWLSVDLLFQVSEDEIQASLKEQGKFAAAKVDGTDIRSYLFFAVELKDQQYTRAQLSGITRQINRLFETIPAMILFKHGGLLSVAIIARRLNKKDSGKDVLEKVTIIKDISFASPHRAHLEILLDLSVDALQSRYALGNFDELQKAWEQVLDTSALNKKFFREVASWYFWAVDTVKFPAPARPSPNSANLERESVSTEMSVIRFITRLIFVWFIKEMRLVPEDLFDERKLKDLLLFNDPKKSNYYKAILQNLFFATLNTEMGEARKFRGKNKNANGLDAHHGISTVYRYEDYFKAPKDALKLFSNIPFLNGGLFECLDKPEEKIYIDGFSDTPKNQPVLPDDLFFGAERPVDLSEAYGDARRSHEKVRGLIHIFKDYKFTVEENTPIEEEVALDPELLGKVFENLLAAYNPETGTTARKQTGSFYTPREIVNYMVDEALIAYLESALKDLTGFTSTESDSNARADNGADQSDSRGNLSGLQDELRHLFAYNNEAPLFNEAETLTLIAAINNLKAFDPACGSGAFPMGMLHKLVFVLKKLDPDNSRWREFQISKVADFPELVAQVEDSFKNNNDDYGRKLYLIQNCIYGADIQPIAVQITKLRFFISLVVEQKVDDSKPNRGIQPLPNLETKFVAANTLIGLQRPEKKEKESAPSLSPELTKKCEMLVDIFRQYSKVSKPELKAKYLEQAMELGDEINKALKKRPDFQPLQVEWIFQTASSVDMLKERLPLERPVTATMMTLRNPVIDEKEKQLAEARKRHFSARTPATKAKYRQQDKKLRGELADLLKQDGWGSETAKQLAGWDPYDQNAHAEFFDTEWMFGFEGGFHIVLGNPPYLQLQKAHEISKQLASLDYETYTKAGDLYCLFYEKSVYLLKQNGVSTLITSNSWLRTQYGEPLRNFFVTKTNPILLLDFQDAQLFESAIVETNILFVQKASWKKNLVAVSVKADLNEYESITEYVVKNGVVLSELDSNSWSIGDQNYQNLKRKIETGSTPLHELDIEINFGIKTGFNEAFIIDEETKNELIAKDKKNKKIIQPLLRGRDVKKYIYSFSNVYLINAHNGLRKSGLERIDIPRDYPVVYEYFKKYKTQLETRQDKGAHWTNLRNCAYLDEFQKEKIIWGELSDEPKFAYDEDGIFAEATLFFMTGSNLKYLLAILNCKLSEWYFNQISTSSGMGTNRWKKYKIEVLPIKQAKPEIAKQITSFVTKILAAKRANPQANTKELERDIDLLVYDLYGLTKDERDIVEGKNI